MMAIMGLGMGIKAVQELWKPRCLNTCLPIVQMRLCGGLKA